MSIPLLFSSLISVKYTPQLRYSLLLFWIREMILSHLPVFPSCHLGFTSHNHLKVLPRGRRATALLCHLSPRCPTPRVRCQPLTHFPNSPIVSTLAAANLKPPCSKLSPGSQGSLETKTKFLNIIHKKPRGLAPLTSAAWVSPALPVSPHYSSTESSACTPPPELLSSCPSARNALSTLFPPWKVISPAQPDSFPQGTTLTSRHQDACFPCCEKPPKHTALPLTPWTVGLLTCLCPSLDFKLLEGHEPYLVHQLI